MEVFFVLKEIAVLAFIIGWTFGAFRIWGKE
jgi:hypothetical protein